MLFYYEVTIVENQEAALEGNSLSSASIRSPDAHLYTRYGHIADWAETIVWPPPYQMGVKRRPELKSPCVRDGQCRSVRLYLTGGQYVGAQLTALPDATEEKSSVTGANTVRPVHSYIPVRNPHLLS